MTSNHLATHVRPPLRTTPESPGTDPLADPIEDLGRAAVTAAGRLERDRDLTGDLYERAAGLGLFRQLVPADLGGRNEAPLVWFRRGVNLARHEPSIAWVVTQGAIELAWIGAGGDEAWARHVLSDPQVSSASTIAGSGVLQVEGDEATLSGSWGFDTGCRHASWVGGLAIVDGLDPVPDGISMRMCWVPSERAELMDDWDSTGMRGTGSHSITIHPQRISMAWTIDVFHATTNDRGPYRCLVGNGNWPIAAAVAATQLGNARRALDACRELVAVKAPAPDFIPLAQNAAVQRCLTELEGAWMGAVASVERELEAMWDEAERQGELSSGVRWRLAAANTHANRAAVHIVDEACNLTGTAVADRSGVLGRSLRDAHTLAGHIATSGPVLERAAQVSLGLLEPDLLV